MEEELEFEEDFTEKEIASEQQGLVE